MNRKILLACLVALCLLVSVAYAQPNTEISAKEIEYDSTTQTVKAEGDVVIKHEGGQTKAARAVYNMRTGQGTLSGGVQAQRGEVGLSCEQLDMISRTQVLASGGNVLISRGGDKLRADQVEYFDDRKVARTLGGWARLTQADGNTLVANSINYDMVQGQAEAEGNVNIEAPGRNLIATGDYAVYVDERNGRDATITLIGNANAIQDGNKISGEKLSFKTGKSQGEATGKVVMEIPPAQPKPQQPPAAQPPALKPEVAAPAKS